ncbi:MAG: hypothetical protein QM604_07750 [Microbacterium sp.]
MTADVQQLVLADGRVTARHHPAEPHDDAAILVYLHGGASSAEEADVQLSTAATVGHRGFSLQRPGYPGSAHLDIPGDADEGYYAESARLVDAAITELWQTYGAGSAGVVLVGCSVGSAIAFTVAAARGDGADAAWPLLGVAAADIGHRPKPGVPELWNGTPVADRIDDVGPWIGELDFGPEWARYQTPGDGGPTSISRAEALEYVGGWPRHALEVARAVRTPVFWRVSEFDPLWQQDAASVAEFVAALQTSSPSVDGGVMLGASHAIHDGPRGRSWLFSVLAFADLCRTAATTPQLFEPR